jgi:alcohol dehydrogenase
MKALVHHEPGQKAWEDVPKLEISADTDAIVRVDAPRSLQRSPR